MMAAKENFPNSMMGFVFEKLGPSLLPTDKLLCGEYLFEGFLECQWG